MANQISSSGSYCDGISRRGMLQLGALGGLGLTLPMALAGQARAGDKAKKTNCILIWTRGG
ncbi:MAG: DUF1501 domain-containing protein, partial [Planctomycetota bacterium]|nr:DUF1501 domain-containing protein [Planctomycetota bacterium]